MIPDIMTQSEMIGVLVMLLFASTVVLGTMILMIWYLERK
jgi:hypothetical protein